MIEDVHVYPLNDLKAHDTESRNCHCLPTIDLGAAGDAVVIHNSFDGREITEQAILHAFTHGAN